MKPILILLLTIITAYGQTFKICEIPKTKKTLNEVDGSYLIKMVYGPTAEGSSLSKDILYVPTNQHPVIYAAHTAFADHRGLVLSPDIIWLMISQGFATHVRINAESFRAKLVDFLGKSKIEIIRNDFIPGSPDNDWYGVIEEFNSKINTNKNLEKIIFGDFSTTDATALTAYRIAHMDSVSKYYDFSMTTLCGIPEITLEGKTEDWEKIFSKLDALKEYKLDKWVESLKPIIKEFINASKGNVNKDFWQSIYKIHGESGGPYVTGWLLNFFPYNANNKMREFVYFDEVHKMKNIVKSHYETTFPKGQSKVDFEWKYLSKKLDMEINGGFIGIIQNKQNVSVKPNIAWAIAGKNMVKVREGELPYWMKERLYLMPGKDIKFSHFPSVKYLDAFIKTDDDLIDVKQLRLLEYINVKGYFEGRFLKYLQDSQFLEYIDCDWNLEEKYLPLLRNLKISSFRFDHKMNRDVLKFLPETTASIYFNDISLSPQNIKDLTSYKNLKYISFSKCSLPDESLEILAQFNLEEISFNECKISDISLSKTLNAMTDLKEISIEETPLKTLTLNNPALARIVLVNNELSSITLGQLDKLEWMNLSHNKLETFELKSQSATSLDLSNNSLKKLSLETPLLKRLKLSKNSLTSLNNIDKFPLQSLDIENNPLTSFSLPKSLTSLRIFFIPLSLEMKKEISNCLKLESLYLYDCKISKNDGWIFNKLTHLRSLILSKQEIDDLTTPWVKDLLSKEILVLW